MAVGICRNRSVSPLVVFKRCSSRPWTIESSESMPARMTFRRAATNLEPPLRGKYPRRCGDSALIRRFNDRAHRRLSGSDGFGPCLLGFRHRIAMRLGAIFFNRFSVICSVQPRSRKYSVSPRPQITLTTSAIPSREEGRWPSSRTLGRVAVDAAASGAKDVRRAVCRE